MKYGPIIFLGIFLTFASSWYGLVLLPQVEYGGLATRKNEETGRAYPTPRFGSAARGEQVYRANGCIYCHSQQVRPAGFGADLLRGWGQRRTVSRDYIYDTPVMLGTMRTGPDLSNIGGRQPSIDWHMSHLYNPETTSRGSVMPRFPFFFEKARMGARPRPGAVKLSPQFAPAPGLEVLPTAQAQDLVAYLLSLKSDAPLPEAPLGK